MSIKHDIIVLNSHSFDIVEENENIRNIYTKRELPLKELILWLVRERRGTIDNITIHQNGLLFNLKDYIVYIRKYPVAEY